MTSVRENRTPEQKAANLARLRALHPGVRRRDIAEVKDLPRWAKMAVLYKVVYNYTYRRISERVGRSPRSCSNVCQSPAGKKLAAELEALVDDSSAMARAFLRSSALDLSVEVMLNLEAAKAAGDYKEVRLILSDLLDRAGVEKAAKPTSAPQVIHLHVGNATAGLLSASAAAALPMGESDYEIRDAEIIEENATNRDNKAGG